MKKQSSVFLTGWQIVTVSVLFVVLVGGAAVLGVNWPSLFGQEGTNVSKGFQIDKDAGYLKENTQQDYVENSKATSIKLPGYAQIKFKKNTKVLDVVLENPSGNPCYFQFSIIDEKGNLLYQSKMIPPAQGIINATVDPKKAVGKHKIVIKIDTFSLIDHSAMNSAKMESVLVVE